MRAHDNIKVYSKINPQEPVWKTAAKRHVVSPLKPEGNGRNYIRKKKITFLFLSRSRLKSNRLRNTISYFENKGRLGDIPWICFNCHYYAGGPWTSTTWTPTPPFTSPPCTRLSGSGTNLYSREKNIHITLHMKPVQKNFNLRLHADPESFGTILFNRIRIHQSHGSGFVSNGV